MKHGIKENCKQCGAPIHGKYCSNCGQPTQTNRLTLPSILHEVFHFFTHLEKGFLYTLKQLITSPGHMQRNYIDGRRIRYQKPFSLFFVCGTITATILYLIHKPSGDVSHFDEVQGDFTRHYYVLLQAILLPFYSFLTWLLFRNNKLNFAESLVLFTYTLSMMLLIVIVTNLFDLLPNKSINSAFYEIPVLFSYLLITNLNFFKAEPKWRLILKTLINILMGYFVFKFASDLFVKFLM